jgi:hypothetical protein
MFKKRLSFVAILCLVVLSGAATEADEGMWPLYDLHKLPFDSLKARGLMLGPEEIYNPEGGAIAFAVVSIGATGSFVSPNGLIITNHHVAFGAVQKQSTVERNYLRDGFYAASRQEEIPAIGYDVYVTLSIEDMTQRVMDVVKEGMSDLERYKAIERVSKEIIKEAEEGRDVKCELAEMLGGTQYVLYTYFKIRDVRIVYVPPRSIGEYGGDIDNWMWPRHTGDFSFLRAYVAPDGSSAEFSEDNVPYRPKVYLPVCSAGVKEGDFVMMMGFPGQTDRYASSYYIDYLVNYYYPQRIRTLEDRLRILEEASAADSAVALRLASRVSSINNSLKNSYGVVEGFRKSDILQKKQRDERLLTDFLQSDLELMKEFGLVLPELKRLHQERSRTRDRDFILGWMQYSSDFLDMAVTLYKWAAEREKGDIDRERGYQDRDSISTKEWLQEVQINLVPQVDKEMLMYYIRRAWELPSGQKIEALEKIFSGKTGEKREEYLNKFTDRLYTRTQLGDLDRRLQMFHMSKEKLGKLKDPFIELAIALKPEIDELEKRDNEFSGAQSRLAPKLIAAYAKWKQQKIYPDANGTMRFNYGAVKGYIPRDAVRYDYITSLSGVMEKETGKDPFIVPAELKWVYEQRDFGNYLDSIAGDVPVNLLTTNDGTGGNSGSPVLNGKGELIGLDFDGNYESVSDDYLYNPELSRSIIVDIRYVLFLIDKVYHLDDLLGELTIH